MSGNALKVSNTCSVIMDTMKGIQHNPLIISSEKRVWGHPKELAKTERMRENERKERKKGEEKRRGRKQES